MGIKGGKTRQKKREKIVKFSFLQTKYNINTSRRVLSAYEIKVWTSSGIALFYCAFSPFMHCSLDRSCIPSHGVPLLIFFS